MKTTYGYCRVSTQKQKLDRQRANILAEAPEAIIFEESFTGTTTDRPQWKKLVKAVKKDDVIIFDEVSRMSRNAEEGFQIYEELFKKGVELIFLKERHIDTSVFKKAESKLLDTQIDTGSKATDKLMKNIIDAINVYQLDVIREQIYIAFEKAESEVNHLHVRTSEGMRASGATNVYDADGNLIEQGSISKAKTGKKLTTKKSIEAKETIRKHSKDFGGSLSDADCQKLAQCSRNSFYKYKRELKLEDEITRRIENSDSYIEKESLRRLEYEESHGRKASIKKIEKQVREEVEQKIREEVYGEEEQ